MAESNGIKVETLDSWDDFKSVITGHTRGTIEGKSAQGSCWYRGLPDSEYELQSSFDREIGDYFGGPEKKTIIDNFIEDAKERLTLLSDWSSGEEKMQLGDSDDELLSIAQHFGIQTRLLDWSESPYIAAFFAFSDLKSTVLNVLPKKRELDDDSSSSHCSVWALNTRAAAWNSDAGVTLVKPSRAGNRRMQRQHGFFTRNSSLKANLKEYCCDFYDKHPDSDVALTNYLIPKNETRIALRDLELMGISSETLFPGAEGALRYALFRSIDRSVGLG